jgi:hypothetical protein
MHDPVETKLCRTAIAVGTLRGSHSQRLLTLGQRPYFLHQAKVGFWSRARQMLAVYAVALEKAMCSTSLPGRGGAAN